MISHCFEEKVLKIAYKTLESLAVAYAVNLIASTNSTGLLSVLFTLPLEPLHFFFTQLSPAHLSDLRPPILHLRKAFLNPQITADPQLPVLLLPCISSLFHLPFLR